MSWQDFQIHFRSIYVCRVYPPRPEMRYTVHSQWRGYSAGGCQDYDTWHQNPQFRLRVNGPDASLPIHVFIIINPVMILWCFTLECGYLKPVAAALLTTYTCCVNQLVGRTKSILEKYHVKWFWTLIQRVIQ